MKVVRRWLNPLLQLLQQGITPEKLALTVAAGVVLGITPVLGSTTILCTLAALTLRLNLPAIQVVNGLVYPLQLILLIPFYRGGEWLFGAEAIDISVEGVKALLSTGILPTIGYLWTTTLHALVFWAISGAFAGIVLYAALVPLIRRFWPRHSASS